MIFANEYRKFYIVCKIIVGVMVSNKNYVKRGPSFREVLRCPLCGKLSRIGFFSHDHQCGFYRFRFGGRDDISCEIVDKDYSFVSALKKSFIGRFLSLLEGFAGCKYYSQFEVDKMLFERGSSFTAPVFSKLYVPTFSRAVAPNVSKIFAPIVAKSVVVE